MLKQLFLDGAICRESDGSEGGDAVAGDENARRDDGEPNGRKRDVGGWRRRFREEEDRLV
jgi:hypothetical protein